MSSTRLYLSTQCNIIKELNLFQHPSENFNNSSKFTFRSVENDKLCAFYVASSRLQPVFEAFIYRNNEKQ